MARTPIAITGLLAVAASKARSVVSLPGDACGRFVRRELAGDELALLGRVGAKRLAAFPTPDAPRFEQAGLKSVQGVGALSMRMALRQLLGPVEKVIAN